MRRSARINTSIGRKVRKYRPTYAAITCVLFSIVATSSAQTQGPHEAIHPKERYFTPDAVRKALAGDKSTALPGLPGGVSSDMIANLFKKAAENPEQFKSLAEMVQKAAGVLPLDKFDPDKADPRIREFAERLAKNPEFRDRLLENPEFKKLAESIRNRMGNANAGESPQQNATERVPKATSRDRQNRETAGTAVGSSDIDKRGSSTNDDQGNAASNPRTGSTNGPPSGRRLGDPKVAVERANRAFRKLWTGNNRDSSRSRRTDGGWSTDGIGNWNDNGSRPRRSDLDRGGQTWAEQWAERLQNGDFQKRATSDKDGATRSESIDRENLGRRQDPVTDSRSRRTSDSGRSEQTNRDVPRGDHGNSGRDSASDDWFSWFSSHASKAGQVGAKAGERLGSALPKLPAMKLPEVRLPQMRVPNIRLPASGLPTLPAGGFTVQGMGSSLAILLAIIGLFALGMSYSGKISSTIGNASLTRLVRRRLKSTDANEQVRWIFESVALDKLGDKSAAMNHRAIESNLTRQQPATTEAAREFAELYERARYIPSLADLNQADVARAKHLADLLRSTGGSAALN